MAARVAPVNALAEVVAVTPVNALPLPLKNNASTLPDDVIEPNALTAPAVVKLPPTTLPVAVTTPTVFRFCAVTLPEADNIPGVIKFPPVMFPDADKLANTPTFVKLLSVTLALSVFPIKSAAFVVPGTLVNNAPLPINNPVVDTILPTALIALATVVPTIVTPVPVTVTTLATLALLMRIGPLSAI